MAARPAEVAPEALGLDVVARVAETLAQGLPRQETLAAVAGILEATLGVKRVRIWVRTPEGEGLRSVDAAGESEITAESSNEESTDDPTRLCVPLIQEAERLGEVTAALTPSAIPELTRRVFEIVANTLAPLLATYELSQDLASEIALGAREIQAQREFTAKIIDSLPVGLYVIDENYVIQAWNRKRETGTQGVSRDEAIGRNVFQILHRQPRDLLRREFEDVFRFGALQQVELETTGADGEHRYYRISKIPMRLHNDDVSHVITIGEDITEWRQVRAQIAQTEKLAAIGQLAAGVMHEINNPLATISACAEALELRVDEVPESARAGFTEYLQIVEAEVRRCIRIVDGLLDFSRPKPREKKPTDVNAIVEETLFLLKHHDRFKRMEVVSDLYEDLPPVKANQEQLVQVFMALLLNAIDAMNTNGKLMVRTLHRTLLGDEVVIEFTDSGAGIPQAEINKIFEPFYTTKPPGRGTGLGLSICYGIIDEHRGHIEVDSEPGLGSTFRVSLPAVGL